MCVYCDSDWASDLMIVAPPQVHVFSLALILWSGVQRNKCLLLGQTHKLNTGALTHATTKLRWLESLLSELHTEYLVLTLLCDNLSAILLSHNLILCARTKDIKLDIHYVREKVVANPMYIQHVSAHAQRVDALIKLLPIALFIDFRDKFRGTLILRGLLEEYMHVYDN